MFSFKYKFYYLNISFLLTEKKLKHIKYAKNYHPISNENAVSK